MMRGGGRGFDLRGGVHRVYKIIDKVTEFQDGETRRTGSTLPEEKIYVYIAAATSRTNDYNEVYSLFVSLCQVVSSRNNVSAESQ